MSKKRMTVVIGGGTFNHIRNHMSLAAPAFGTTARYINTRLKNSHLILTKMADRHSKIVTNQDLSNQIDKLIADERNGTIIMNAAVCDFNATIGDIESDSHADRLQTKNGDVTVTLTPSEKIIGRIRKERPDIYLVGFKTTTGMSSDDQYYTALKFMKSTKCNLVLANDVVTRNNMIITPEEAKYNETTDREIALNELCDIIDLRENLTYNRTNLDILSPNYKVRDCPENFQTVLRYLIDNGGFIENNGNGFTPGHFCWKISSDKFVSSQRKADHNKVFENGMTLVVRQPGSSDLFAYGDTKPSVGATSQRLVFDEYPDYDCIIHTHNPKKETSDLPVADQRPYQCGSLECGQNTVNNMKVYNNDIAAVYLNKHGANILFKSETKPQKVIDFINKHLQLGVKVS